MSDVLHLIKEDTGVQLVIGVSVFVAICFVCYLCSSSGARGDGDQGRDLEQQWKDDFIANVRDYRATEKLIAASMTTPDYEARWERRKMKGAGKATC